MSSFFTAAYLSLLHPGELAKRAHRAFEYMSLLDRY
jgi:hypothetical protein